MLHVVIKSRRLVLEGTEMLADGETEALWGQGLV